MEKVEIAEIIEVVAKALNINETTLDDSSTSDSVDKWDSLGHLHICMALEDRFGVQIEMERISDLDSIVKINQYLNRIA